MLNLEDLEQKLVNNLDTLSAHEETIICPECSTMQNAIVLHSIPFNIYLHTCESRKYVIMESDWIEAEAEVAWHLSN